MTKKLSPTQERLLERIGDGVLIRWPGGYWTGPDTKADPLGPNVGHPAPEWSFSTSTVRALIDKGLLVATKTEPFDGGTTLMPVEVKKAEAQP